jgi:hypothetical protein
MSALTLGDYIVRRIRLRYSLNQIIYPLLREARRMHSFTGLFLKFKGRYTRKPRSKINKKIFKYGKIGFSSVYTNVDYAFRRFESRFGTCSIKIWVCHKKNRKLK